MPPELRIPTHRVIEISKTCWLAGYRLEDLLPPIPEARLTPYARELRESVRMVYQRMNEITVPIHESEREAMVTLRNKRRSTT